MRIHCLAVTALSAGISLAGSASGHRLLGGDFDAAQRTDPGAAMKGAPCDAGVRLLLAHVADVDAFFARATADGAAVLRPPTDQLYGDRSCTVKDPFGHTWSLATHVEEAHGEARRLASRIL